MKITEATTLGELTLRKAQLGIESITIVTMSPSQWVGCLVRTTTNEHRGEGLTLIDALDQAFARVEDAIGIRLLRDRDRGVR